MSNPPASVFQPFGAISGLVLAAVLLWPAAARADGMGGIDDILTREGIRAFAAGRPAREPVSDARARAAAPEGAARPGGLRPAARPRNQPRGIRS